MGKFGINTTLVVLEMGNFTRLHHVKFFLFPMQYSWYLSQISLLPMLLHILIAWVAVKFGINVTSVTLKMGQISHFKFQIQVLKLLLQLFY